MELYIVFNVKKKNIYPINCCSLANSLKLQQVKLSVEHFNFEISRDMLKSPRASLIFDFCGLECVYVGYSGDKRSNQHEFVAGLLTQQISTQLSIISLP